MDPKFNEYIKLAKLHYQFPPKEAAKDEAREEFPFTTFGYSGGFGKVRSDLKKFILLGRWALAEAFYYLLIAETVDEYVTEYNLEDVPMYDSPEQVILSMVASINNLGHQYDDPL